MKNIFTASILLVLLSGCIEIWETEVKNVVNCRGYNCDEGPKILFSTWKFSMEGCVLARIAAVNRLESKGIQVWDKNCELTAYYGF